MMPPVCSQHVRDGQLVTQVADTCKCCERWRLGITQGCRRHDPQLACRRRGSCAEPPHRRPAASRRQRRRRQQWWRHQQQHGPRRLGSARRSFSGAARPLGVRRPRPLPWHARQGGASLSTAEGIAIRVCPTYNMLPDSWASPISAHQHRRDAEHVAHCSLTPFESVSTSQLDVATCASSIGHTLPHPELASCGLFSCIDPDQAATCRETSSLTAPGASQQHRTRSFASIAMTSPVAATQELEALAVAAAAAPMQQAPPQHDAGQAAAVAAAVAAGCGPVGRAALAHLPAVLGSLRSGGVEVRQGCSQRPSICKACGLGWQGGRRQKGDRVQLSILQDLGRSLHRASRMRVQWIQWGLGLM
jgi:hypothetical protein